MNPEERIERLEIEVKLLKKFVIELTEEFQKFNQLADQIKCVADEAGDAVKTLANTKFSEV